MAEGERPSFRGGRKSRRDRLYGLETLSDVDAFLRWWHRAGKRQVGIDLDERTAATTYREWVQLGRPKAG